MSTSLLNRSAVKQFILAKLETLRPGLGLTRVSAEAIDKLDAKLRVLIIGEINRHPTVGKTFKIE